jgi:hypothetical protein
MLAVLLLVVLVARVVKVGGSEERIESTWLSNAGSHSEAGDIADEGSHSRSYFFGAST